MNPAEFCEDAKRLPPNARLGTVWYPNGSRAVLPGDAALQVACVREVIRLHEEK